MLTTLSSRHRDTNGVVAEINMSPLDNDLIARCRLFHDAEIVCVDVTSENANLWITLVNCDRLGGSSKCVTVRDNRARLG